MRSIQPGDLHEARHQQQFGIWGLVTERQIFKVHSVSKDMIHGATLRTEKIVDDNWTVEYDDSFFETVVQLDDVSEKDRPREPRSTPPTSARLLRETGTAAASTGVSHRPW